MLIKNFNINPLFFKELYSKLIWSLDEISVPYLKLEYHYDKKKLKGFSIYKKENSLEITYKEEAKKEINDDDVFKDGYHIIFTSTNIVDPLEYIALTPSLLDVFFTKNKTFFLPANRNFYPNFYKYIYEVAKKEKDLISENINNGQPNLNKIKNLSKRPYTKPMDDLIEKTYNLNSNTKPQNHYPDLLKRVVKLLGGEIVVKSSEGIAPIEFMLQMENGQELDMHLSSSASNQLATLYLYLKYWAGEKNNFLIMDEPEENLHPQHQVELLDILMQFADRNENRVLITTHSPLMTDAVNNHINLGRLQSMGIDTEKIAQEHDLKISQNKNLQHTDFGVYFFGNDTITPYEVDDYGVFFRDFRQEQRNIQNTANILRDYIHEALYEKA